jgi:hypothetical protein
MWDWDELLIDSQHLMGHSSNVRLCILAYVLSECIHVQYCAAQEQIIRKTDRCTEINAYQSRADDRHVRINGWSAWMLLLINGASCCGCGTETRRSNLWSSYTRLAYKRSHHVQLSICPASQRRSGLRRGFRRETSADWLRKLLIKSFTNTIPQYKWLADVLEMIKEWTVLAEEKFVRVNHSAIATCTSVFIGCWN